MTKSQIIRELTIELAAKCKLVRELDRDLNVALSRNTELNNELRRVEFQNKTLESHKKQAEAKYEGESAARERVLEHVKSLEAEIERMREDTMRMVIRDYDSCASIAAINQFKTALGIIK